MDASDAMRITTLAIRALDSDGISQIVFHDIRNLLTRMPWGQVILDQVEATDGMFYIPKRNLVTVMTGILEYFGFSHCHLAIEKDNNGQSIIYTGIITE